MSFILNAIQVFFLFLAECIFDIGVKIYSLVIQIAQSDFFSQEIIRDFSGRIYVLLGIFMLFKVSFSLINYIVNPDDFTDKQKGIGKLVPNIMITLVLIVFMPRIFAEAMDLQRLVINEGVLENIIFSSNHDNELNLNSETGGEKIAVQIFNSFYYLKEVGMDSDARSITTCQNGECRYNTYTDAFDSDSSYNAYEGIWDDQAEYHQFLTLIAAVIFVLVMIQFCFDIAVRTVKLGFLQLIAPIPIISRMDPKSAKDGMFSRWLKECKNTYLALFVRLIALDFAIVLIGIIINSSELSNMDFMVRVFLILGILMFAKQLPGLIEKIFGIKLDSGFTLNPMKRLKDVPGSHIASAGLAGAVGAGIGMITNVRSGIKSNNGFRKTFGSALAGGLSGGFRSTYSGLKDNKNKPFKAALSGAKGSVAARNLRDERKEAGESGVKGFFERNVRKFDQFSGITGSDEETIKREKNERLGKELYESFGEYKTDGNNNLVIDENGKYVKTGKSKYSILKDVNSQSKWKLLDDLKSEKYAYQNVSSNEINEAIKDKGYYELKYKDVNGKDKSQKFYSESEFNKEKASKLKAYDNITKDLENSLSKDDKRRYNAYNDYADRIEAITKFNNGSDDQIIDTSTNDSIESITKFNNGSDDQIIDTSTNDSIESIQDRINRIYNVHDDNTIDQHNSRYEDLISAFGEPIFEDQNQENRFINQTNININRENVNINQENININQGNINQNQGNINQANKNQDRTDLYGGGGFDDSDLE